MVFDVAQGNAFTPFERIVIRNSEEIEEVEFRADRTELILIVQAKRVEDRNARKTRAWYSW
jgi:hypothetical protein